MKKKYVLKNKVRFYTVVFTTLFVIFTFVFTTSVHGFKEKTYETITVRRGDTLWDIAVRYNKSRDVRKYIYEIKKLNSLSDSIIYEGDKLILPR